MTHAPVLTTTIPFYNILEIDFEYWTRLLIQNDKQLFRSILLYHPKKKRELRLWTDIGLCIEERECVCNAINYNYCFLCEVHRAYIMHKPNLTLGELYSLIRWSEKRRQERLRLPTIYI